MPDGELLLQGNHVQERSPRLSTPHLDTLLQRGLTLETIEAAGLWSASREEVTRLLRFDAGSGGIVIPYRHPLTGEVVLTRVKPDTPPIINGKPAKYLSPRGAENRLYVPPNSAELLRSTAPLIITEGEFKTLLAYQHGLFCIGLVGVYGFRGRNAQGEKGPIADLDLLTWEDRVVLIVYDSDAATNERVREAREALAWELYRRGVQVAHSIDLPELNGEKAGLDDFLVAQGVDAFFGLDVDEISSPYPKVKLWRGVDLRAVVRERPPAIVKAWGIRRGGKVILVGMGGRGKSTLLLQIACNLAAGAPLLDHGALEVAGPQRVAVFMAEDPLSEVKFRWEQQMRALEYGNKVAERIAFFDTQGARLALTDEHSRQALFDALRRHQTTVAILDPLVSLHDVEENSNSAMRRVLDWLTPFAEETGCTFIIAHHEPKAPENNSAASRGASAIRDWCRTMLRLSHQGRDDNSVARFKLDLDKANYGGTVWRLSLERQQDSYVFTASNREVTVTPRDVWELLGPEGGWLEDVKARIVKRFGVSEPTARRALRNAEVARLAVQGARTNPETGREKTYVTRGTGGQQEGTE